MRNYRKKAKVTKATKPPRDTINAVRAELEELDVFTVREIGRINDRISKFHQHQIDINAKINESIKGVEENIVHLYELAETASKADGVWHMSYEDYHINHDILVQANVLLKKRMDELEVQEQERRVEVAAFIDSRHGRLTKLEALESKVNNVLCEDAKRLFQWLSAYEQRLYRVEIKARPKKKPF